jgi:hypothetical protein
LSLIQAKVGAKKKQLKENIEKDPNQGKTRTLTVIF